MPTRMISASIVTLLVLGHGSAPAIAQEPAAEIVMLNGAHRVPVLGFGPSLELSVGEFVPPSGAGEFFFVAERDAFFHADIDAMGGAPSGEEAPAVAGAVAAAEAASNQAEAENPSVPSEPAPLTWRSVGVHRFDLVYAGTTYSCFAGKISESNPRENSSLGEAAAELSDPRLYRVQCMGWQQAG